jgi:transposase-like protein
MTSAEKAAAAKELRQQGWSRREIAAKFGCAESTVQNWWAAKSCETCGGPTADPASATCRSCRKERERSPSYRAELTYWTRERIIEAIRRWERLYGEPPSLVDWHPGRARAIGDEERAVRWEQARADGKRSFPHHTTVFSRFGAGGWNRAIREAGFEPRVRHGGGGNQLRRRRVRDSMKAQAA